MFTSPFRYSPSAKLFRFKERNNAKIDDTILVGERGLFKTLATNPKNDFFLIFFALSTQKTKISLPAFNAILLNHFVKIQGMHAID